MLDESQLQIVPYSIYLPRAPGGKSRADPRPLRGHLSPMRENNDVDGSGPLKALLRPL
jgi:hypothetical protein